ncbi:hypothetical protein V1499_09830 [Neobacillus sp. SCS-31]|uniref:hypothetical protein n=1 Tax=Neobacillus oceani TaxID=3115292 RepID=UPI0039067E04
MEEIIKGQETKQPNVKKESIIIGAILIIMVVVIAIVWNYFRLDDSRLNNL